MILTIDLPDELAERFVAMLSEEERRRFSVAAISDALMFRQDERAIALPFFIASRAAGRFTECCSPLLASRSNRLKTETDLLKAETLRLK